MDAPLPAQISEEMREEADAKYNEEGGNYSGDDDDEADAEECITLMLDRRFRRTAGGAHVDEVLVRRQGYSKPTWMDCGELIEQGLLAPSLLRAFEKKQKAQQESVPTQKPATAATNPSGPISRSQQKKSKKKARVPEPMPALQPPTHLAEEDEVKIHYPQKEVDYDEDGLRAELQENAALRTLFEKHLMTENFSQVTYSVKRGGFVSYSFGVTHGDKSIFCKVNLNAHAEEMYSLLNSIHQARDIAGIISLPAGTGVILPDLLGIIPLKRRVGAALILQYLPVRSPTTSDRQRLARKLAEIHSVQRGTFFGCPFDTYWANIRKPAGMKKTWLEFLITCRFQPLLAALKRISMCFELVLLLERLLVHLPFFFDDIPPGGLVPVLLHGDLAPSSNWSALGDSVAFFDSVPCFGHSEMDLYKIGEVNDFREEYTKHCPLRPKFELRRDLYSLYYELTKIRTGFDPPRMVKNSLHRFRLLLSTVEPAIVCEFAFGTPLPLWKLREPENPTSDRNVVLLFGGSFGPVHINHVSVMESARRWLEKHRNVQVLGGWFCPSTDYHLGRKLAGQGVLSREVRLAAILLATRGTIWSPMLASRSPLITAAFIQETVLQNKGWLVKVVMVYVRPELAFYGADNFHWVARNLNSGNMVIVIRRNSYDEELQNSINRLPRGQHEKLCVDDEWRGPDISSSRIRSAIKAGDWHGAATMLPPGVADLLQDHYCRVALPP